MNARQRRVALQKQRDFKTADDSKNQSVDLQKSLVEEFKKLNELPLNEQKKDDSLFVLGNDPQMNIRVETEGVVVLIATSGLRFISLACQLADKNKKIPPITLLIDFNQNVIKFLKSVIKRHNDTQTSDEFLKFITKNTEVNTYFKKLYQDYSYPLVKKIIKNAVPICQNWDNEELFTKIRVILDNYDIQNRFLYPSNIVAVQGPFSNNRTKILNNIQTIDPTLVFHSDVTFSGYPHHIFYCEENNPTVVNKKINSFTLDSIYQMGIKFLGVLVSWFLFLTKKLIEKFNKDSDINKFIARNNNAVDNTIGLGIVLCTGIFIVNAVNEFFLKSPNVAESELFLSKKDSNMRFTLFGKNDFPEKHGMQIVSRQNHHQSM